MTLSERCAGLFGPRPVQVFDPGFISAAARERRDIIKRATSKADCFLQIQIIFHFGLIFGLLIAPLPVALGAYFLMQLTELHSLAVYRAVFQAAQDPQASLNHLKRPIRRLGLGLALCAGVSLVLMYLATPESWCMGVLAAYGLAAAYFIPFAKQSGFQLYSTLAAFLLFMVSAVLGRALFMEEFSFEATAPPLALVFFMTATTIAIAVNVRVEHFKRLDDEELIDHAFSELNAGSRAKSVLLAQLSHEIRTPLNGVLGGVELLRKKDVPDDQRALIEMIRDSGVHLIGLLDRMLDLSAAEVDAIAIRRAPAVLASIFADEVSLFNSRTPEAAVKLVLNDGFCTLPRQVDEIRVRQCIVNLITNAVEHSGGDQITISCAESTETDVSVLISDNGKGVPAHRRDRIFHAFGERGLEGGHAGKGVGLGLALSRSIAKSMGGDLTLQDRDGGGATFVLSFEAPLV